MLDTSTDVLEINIFEGTALRAGRTVRLSDGEFALAAAIALRPLGLPREEWCDMLWPERDLESSARLLKLYVHRIRSKFGTNRVIETYGNGYRLGREVRVDVHVLEALARGRTGESACLAAEEVQCLRRAFDGFTARRYRRFECLATYPELERRLFIAGAELARMLVRDALLRDSNAEALSIAEHVATIDPYDDVAAELVIRTNLRLCRPDAASRYFHTFCRMLRLEFDLPPPPHLVRLF